MTPVIRLRGLSGDIKGKVWEGGSHASILRAGRLGTLEIVLDDGSVSRKHAEVKAGPDGTWTVRDLGSTNGTFVNGVRIGADERLLEPRDIVQFGKMAMIVELNDSAALAVTRDERTKVGSTSPQSWGNALARLAFDYNRSELFLALAHAANHLVQIKDDSELLQALLNDAVAVLGAQRGAIVLADNDSRLQLRAMAGAAGRPGFIQKLAEFFFQNKESMFYENTSQPTEGSVQGIELVSVLCVMLQTPRGRLGVLYLDRNVQQPPFTEDDLRQAGALAAIISMGIEWTEVTRQGRDDSPELPQ